MPRMSSRATICVSERSIMGLFVAVHRVHRRRWMRIAEDKFLMVHFAYMLVLAFCGAALFCSLESDVRFLDALFVAVSCLSCTGLTTVDVSRWCCTSTAVRHVLMVCGGAVFTSSYQPLMRYISFHQLLGDTYAEHKRTTLEAAREIQKSARPNASTLNEESFRESAGGDTNSAHVDQHVGYGALRPQEQRNLVFVIEILHDAALICFVTPLLYFVLVQGTAVFVLALWNSSGLTLSIALQRVVSNFHSCAFASLAPYAGDAVTVFTLGWVCALGYTLAPPFLRVLLVCQRVILCRLLPTPEVCKATASLDSLHESWRRRMCLCWRCRAHRAYALLLEGKELAENTSDEGGVIEEEREMLVQTRALLFHQQRDAATFRELQRCTTLASPTYWYAYLFTSSSCVYLCGAFLFLNLIQFVPYLWQQWSGDGVLAGWPVLQKVNIAWSQSMLSRFSGGLIVNVTQLSNAHISVILFAMYIPALPFPNTESILRGNVLQDKNIAQGKKAVWRLFTSLLTWLFVCAAVITFIDEDVAPPNTKLDAWTRTLFETVSAYSGSGMTLSRPGDPYSFSGALSNVSKFILTCVMFAGRHRAMGLRWSVEQWE